MYVFKKLPKGIEESQNIRIIVDDSMTTLDELLGAFKNFCLACGFHSSNVDCIQYVEEEEEPEGYDGEFSEDDEV